MPQTEEKSGILVDVNEEVIIRYFLCNVQIALRDAKRERGKLITLEFKKFFRENFGNNHRIFSIVKAENSVHGDVMPLSLLPGLSHDVVFSNRLMQHVGSVGLAGHIGVAD